MKENDADKFPKSKKIQDITLSQYHAGDNNEVINFIFDTLPIGVIILNRKIDIIYNNKEASFFLSRFEIPEEIPSVGRRIFDALDREKFQELFPGEIIVTKKLEGSPSNWLFRFAIPINSQPVIVLFILEDKISNKVHVNEIRQQYRLTRRETDILRRVLDGFKNIEISKDLHIVEQTVKDHLSNIYGKIGVENRFDLVRSLVGPSQTFGTSL
ncbi:MAG: helix-turn-helix domain-containing protein [Nitrospirota bacterium]